jgi:hypothetical protein
VLKLAIALVILGLLLDLAGLVYGRKPGVRFADFFSPHDSGLGRLKKKEESLLPRWLMLVKLGAVLMGAGTILFLATIFWRANEARIDQGLGQPFQDADSSQRSGYR